MNLLLEIESLHGILLPWNDWPSLSGITFISIPGSVAEFSSELGLVPSDQFSYMQMVLDIFWIYHSSICLIANIL